MGGLRIRWRTAARAGLLALGALLALQALPPLLRPPSPPPPAADIGLPRPAAVVEATPRRVPAAPAPRSAIGAARIVARSLLEGDRMARARRRVSTPLPPAPPSPAAAEPLPVPPPAVPVEPPAPAPPAPPPADGSVEFSPH